MDTELLESPPQQRPVKQAHHAVAPWVCGKRTKWAVLAVWVLALVVLGPPSSLWIGAAILGLGLGGSFGSALTLLVLRARDAGTVRLGEQAVEAITPGLVHGLGFASVLGGYGSGASALTALAGFNLGVELGQAVVVAFLVPVLRIVQRRPRLHSKVVRLSSICLAGVGLYWMVARAVG